ncbi:hypothetical protein [Amycolatopsis pigmentata]|uniref:Uncharacterized protein n=1 Tax=Amycolatopsis pigmentata TaxID=450801 RepID=A0ABW5FLN7_9PSEU
MREHEVPMLLSATVRELLSSAIGHGLAERDPLSLYELQSAAAGMALEE